jgi:hypothetical protein
VGITPPQRASTQFRNVPASQFSESGMLDETPPGIPNVTGMTLRSFAGGAPFLQPARGFAPVGQPFRSAVGGGALEAVDGTDVPDDETLEDEV